MPKSSKYLVVEHYGLEMPIVFNPVLEHRQVAGNMKVVAAGFCWKNDDDSYGVSGLSVSLGLRCRPQDKEIIEKYLEYSV